MLKILGCILPFAIDFWTGLSIWSEQFIRNVFLEMSEELIASFKKI